MLLAVAFVQSPSCAQLFVIPQTAEFQASLSCIIQNGTGLGGEGSRVGDQDRVGSLCVNQEILGPTCHIQLQPWLQPRDGYL